MYENESKRAQLGRLKITSRLAGLMLSLCSLPVFAVCLENQDLRGVNLAGAEFNGAKRPGVMYKDYTYPSNGEMDYYANKGVNAIRLPVRWERVQRELFAELNEQEMAAIGKTLAAARERGICLILDIHNYGTYNDMPIGSAEVPVEAFHDLWLRIADALDNPRYLVLDLMNEPFTLDIAFWGQVAQSTVNALREAGADQLIFVSGGRWSGVHEWSKTISGASNSGTFADFSDPLGRTVLQVHQYADQYYSGTKNTCHEPAHFNGMFASIEKWAQDNDQQLFLGEFGVPKSDTCLASLDRMLSLMEDSNVWRGWTYWAGGAWWGGYPLSIAPKNGSDAAQMEVVAPYLSAKQCGERRQEDCPPMPPGNLKIDG
ncbi:glycoside hydrolase family 5 protein [Marinobacter sp.]|uniref:glycoside hydrolase family 5 protein n=1 Tax=Marinobacter sp. TaxID=50741 RepID=UPI0019C6E645|nr:glycoside hydrolase family 5 protein [Marinobacter sp.]MBC7193616.1 glycoside hydrolase family 5 protein [Marinobacter sp.]